MKKLHATDSGFTIVELLIVIVVIAILAALTITTFVGANDRAYDSRRIGDTRTLAESVATYAALKGTAIVSGGGMNGNGYGFMNYGNASGPYSGPSINEKLVEADVLNSSYVDMGDPVYNGYAGDYGLYLCRDGSGKETGEFAILFTMSNPVEPFISSYNKYKSGVCGTIVQSDINNLPWNAARAQAY